MASRSEIISQLITSINTIDLEQNPFSAIISKKMDKSSDLRSIHARLVQIKDQHLISVVYRHNTQDITKNYSLSEFCELCKEWMNSTFYNATVHIGNEIHTLLSNKKNASLKVKSNSNKSQNNSYKHDHKKSRLIAENVAFLEPLGISSSNGKVFQASQRKYKQINKYIEIIASLVKNKTINTIADMGCGKGYLSFATYDYLSRTNADLQLSGYDLRPNLMETCNTIAQSLDYVGLKFEVGDISQINIPTTDMVIALHACDIATDMAIAKGIEANAQLIVVSPCCHKQIRKDMKGNNAIASTLSNGIMKERMAEWLTDAIRVLLLQSKGYKTKIMEFISSEHTSKNLLITAEKTKVNTKALDEVKALKEQFGITEHYLETLLNR